MYGPGEQGGLKLVESPQASGFTKPPSVPSGGGGLVGTASDYLRFLQMTANSGELDGCRLLSRKSVELMTMNHLPPHCLPMPMPLKGWEEFARGYGFGLGVKVLMDVAQSQGPGSVGQYGWSGAASTDAWVDPREELIGVFLTQLMPIQWDPFIYQFKELAYQAITD